MAEKRERDKQDELLNEPELKKTKKTMGAGKDACPVCHFEIPFEDHLRCTEFYQHAFGWKTQQYKDMEYYMCLCVESDPKNPVKGAINGGLMKKTEKISHSIIAMSVPDIKETLEEVKQNGGEVVGDITNIGDMGLYVYGKDCEGNLFGVWQDLPSQKAEKKAAEAEKEQENGEKEEKKEDHWKASETVSHFHIPYKNLKKCSEFYESIFKWNIFSTDEYAMAWTVDVDSTMQPLKGGAINGGLVKEDEVSKETILVLHSSNIEDTIKRCEKYGAKIVDPVHPTGSYGFFSRFEDTEGNIIGVWQPVTKDGSQ